MIIKLDDLKPICSKILFALDPSNMIDLSDVLQIKAEGSLLTLSVTNGEYFVEINLPSDNIAVFNATVTADAFLKLIPQFTKEDVVLELEDNSLRVECDGSYRLPLVFEDTSMLELPKIEINNVKNTFEIDSTILKSILDYNSKEFNKGEAVRPVQTLYYIDERGALTFTSGACVNNFSLPEPIKILLNQKLVRLFKFFTEDAVKFTLSEDKLNNEITQTKVRFETANIVITAKINCDKKLMNSFPVEAIRNKSQIKYPYNFTINRTNLIKALNRLIIFDKNREPGCIVSFSPALLSISNENCIDNIERICYENEFVNLESVYTTKLNLKDFKTTLENCSEQFVVIGFGNHETITITRGNISTILPERYA